MGTRKVSPARQAVLLLLGAALVGLPAGSARATAAGTIFSGPASADPAAVYWNPAAMTLLEGTQLMLFGGLSFIRAHYQRDTIDPVLQQPFERADLSVLKPDPAPFLVTDGGLQRFRFGFGVTAPVVDGATWDLEYGGRPSSTRYYAINARLVQFNIEPAAAFRINRYVSIGLGVDIVGMWLAQSMMTDMGAKVNQMACAVAGASSCPLDAPLPREDASLDAETSINGVGWSAGIFGGILITPHPSLRLGLTVHSGGLAMRVPVTMKVQIPGAISDWTRRNLPGVKLPELQAEGEIEITSPMIIKTGFLFQATSRLELASDLQWIQRSRMATLVGTVKEATTSLIGDQVLVKASGDDFLVGLRAAFDLRQDLRLALRLEYGANTRPARFNTPVSLDLHKISLHLGAVWRVHRRVSLYLEYAHYFIPGRTVTESNFQPNASPSTPEEEGFDKPLPSGHYWAETDRVGAGLGLHF